MPLGAGVDVGGTKIAACVADVITGRIVTCEQVPTTQGIGGRSLLASAVSLVEKLASDKEVATVGVGICELVDLDHRVASAYTVDWRDLDVEAAFAKIAPARGRKRRKGGGIGGGAFRSSTPRQPPMDLLDSGDGDLLLPHDRRPAVCRSARERSLGRGANG